MKLLLTVALAALVAVVAGQATVNPLPTLVLTSANAGQSVSAPYIGQFQVSQYATNNGFFETSQVIANPTTGGIIFAAELETAAWGLTDTNVYLFNSPVGLNTAAWASSTITSTPLSATYYSLVGTNQPLFSTVYYLTYNSAGTLYVAADTGFWKYTTTWAQIGTLSYASGSTFAYVYGIAADAAGNLWINADATYNQLFSLPAASQSATAMATQVTSYSDNDAAEAGLAIDSKGNLYFVNENNQQVMQVKAPITEASWQAATVLPGATWVVSYSTSLPQLSTISGISIDSNDRLLVSIQTGKNPDLPWPSTDFVSSIVAVLPGAGYTYAGPAVQIVDGLVIPGPASFVSSTTVTNAGQYYWVDFYQAGGSRSSASTWSTSQPWINITVAGGFQQQLSSTPTIANVIQTGANTVSVAPSVTIKTPLTVVVSDMNGASYGSTFSTHTLTFASGAGPSNPQTFNYTLPATTPLGTVIQLNYTTSAAPFPSPSALAYPFTYSGSLSVVSSIAAGAAIPAGTSLTLTVTATPAQTGTNTLEIYVDDITDQGTFTGTNYCTFSATTSTCSFTWNPETGIASGAPVAFSFYEYGTGTAGQEYTNAFAGPFYFGAVPVGPGGATGTPAPGTSGSPAPGTSGSASGASHTSTGGGSPGAGSTGQSAASSVSVSIVSLFLAAVAGLLAIRA